MINSLQSEQILWRNMNTGNAFNGVSTLSLVKMPFTYTFVIQNYVDVEQYLAFGQKVESDLFEVGPNKEFRFIIEVCPKGESRGDFMTVILKPSPLDKKLLLKDVTASLKNSAGQLFASKGFIKQETWDAPAFDNDIYICDTQIFDSEILKTPGKYLFNRGSIALHLKYLWVLAYIPL